MAKRYNSFAEQRPDLMELWDYEKNGALGLDPKVLSAHSGKKAWWTCREKGHSYLRTIDKQNNKNGRCPKCGKEYITDIPELVKMFDKEKNTINIEELTTGSGKSVWWKCDSDHSFERSVYDHVRRDYKCPTCTHEPITNYPHLVEEFDKEKNTIPIEQVTAGADYKIHWKCKKKGHEWETEPYHRVGGKTNCPHCWRESLVQRSQVTAARKKEERKERDQKINKVANKENIIKETIEEEEIVFELLGKGKKQKTINIEESIAHVYPKLKDLWNKERNGGLEATEVSAYTSAQHYWWKCGKHEWFATLYSMINSTGNGCPYCLKRRSKYSLW